MQAWFEHLNHVVPHVRVLAESLDCQETGHCASASDAKRLPHTATHVYYNYTCHAVAAGPQVSSLFHEAITTIQRPVDPDKPEGQQQVDGDAFDDFVSTFIEVRPRLSLFVLKCQGECGPNALLAQQCASVCASPAATRI